MAIPQSSHVDRLDVSTLRGPLLDDYYGSALQRRDVMAVAEEIMRRHIAKLPVKTGNLVSTARVTAHRSKEHRDRRYEAEYSIGGPRADYIVPLEDEHHYLDQVLREMGFFTGDIVDGPTGTIPASEKGPITPPAEASTTKVRAGLYNVTGGERSFTVEQRHDIPGAPWRASDPGNFFDPHMGDFRTKGEAEAALRDIIERGGD